MPGILSGLAGLALLIAPGPAPSASPPAHGGTVFVHAVNAEEADRTPTLMVENAASKALGAKGFVFLNDPEHAAYIADVVVSRTDVGTGQQKVSAGRASVMGAGVSVPFSTGQTRLVSLKRTEMRISIRRRGDDKAVWSGAAVTVRSPETRVGDADTVASDLGTAAIRIYPKQSATSVGVP